MRDRMQSMNVRSDDAYHDRRTLGERSSDARSLSTNDSRTTVTRKQSGRELPVSAGSHHPSKYDIEESVSLSFTVNVTKNPLVAARGKQLDDECDAKDYDDAPIVEHAPALLRKRCIRPARLLMLLDAHRRNDPHGVSVQSARIRSEGQSFERVTKNNAGIDCRDCAHLSVIMPTALNVMHRGRARTARRSGTRGTGVASPASFGSFNNKDSCNDAA